MSRVTKLARDGSQTSRGKKVHVKGSWDFSSSFYWRKLQGMKKQGGTWTVKFVHLLGMAL